MVVFDKLSILVPAYNEAATIYTVLGSLQSVELLNDISKEIIVVNDASNDGTAEEVKRFMADNPETDVKFFEHAVNSGKGAALHTGISKATGDYLIIQDADLEYDPKEFNYLISNMATNLNLTDMETCYKLFKRDMIQPLKLHEKRFGFEPEVTAKISRIKDIRIYEVGISYYGRTYEEGKKINYKDGFRAIWCIGKYGFLKA